MLRQGSSKDAIEFISVSHLLLDTQSTLKSSLFPQRPPLEKTKFHLQVVLTWRLFLG